jgi:hypothetical protein
MMRRTRHSARLQQEQGKQIDTSIANDRKHAATSMKLGDAKNPTAMTTSPDEKVRAAWRNCTQRLNSAIQCFHLPVVDSLTFFGSLPAYLCDDEEPSADRLGGIAN